MGTSSKLAMGTGFPLKKTLQMNSTLSRGLAANARPSTSDLTSAQIQAPALIDDIRTSLSSPVIDDLIPSSIVVNDAPPTIDLVLTNNGAANESRAPKFTRADELNLADRREVMRNLDLFDLAQKYGFE